MKFGQIKFYAHQLVLGNPIPVFSDRRANRAIDEYVKRIRDAKTFKANTARKDRRK